MCAFARARTWTFARRRGAAQLLAASHLPLPQPASLALHLNKATQRLCTLQNTAHCPARIRTTSTLEACRSAHAYLRRRVGRLCACHKAHNGGQSGSDGCCSALTGMRWRAVCALKIPYLLMCCWTLHWPGQKQLAHSAVARTAGRQVVRECKISLKASCAPALGTFRVPSLSSTYSVVVGAGALAMAAPAACRPLLGVKFTPAAAAPCWAPTAGGATLTVGTVAAGCLPRCIEATTDCMALAFTRICVHALLHPIWQLQQTLARKHGLHTSWQVAGV